MKNKFILWAIFSFALSASLLQSTPVKTRIYHKVAEQQYPGAYHNFSERLTKLNRSTLKFHKKSCLHLALEDKNFNNPSMRLLIKIIEIRLDDLEKHPGLKHHAFQLSAGEQLTIEQLQTYLRNLNTVNNKKNLGVLP